MERPKGVPQGVSDFSEAIRVDDRNALLQCAGLAPGHLPRCRMSGRQAGNPGRDPRRELTQSTNPALLDTLATAHAEAGDFNAAVRWETRAMELLPRDSDSRKGFAARLERFRTEKPYRIPDEGSGRRPSAGRPGLDDKDDGDRQVPPRVFSSKSPR